MDSESFTLTAHTLFDGIHTAVILDTEKHVLSYLTVPRM
jgi:hypothetical protein